MSEAVSYWLEVSITTDGEAAEAVSAALEPYAYQSGVVIEQLGDVTAPSPHALEPEVTVKIYIPEYDDTDSLRRRIDETIYYLGRLYPIPQPQYRKVVDSDWATAWRKNYKPFRIGRRIWIQPSWLEADQTEKHDLLITLDPGMAFGTGLHPSTQMCIENLERLIQPGYSVLDIGTGSGILAIAAAKLGATKVLALDTDRMAVRTVRENVAINDVSEIVEIFQGTLSAIGHSQWDIVVVNILAPVIINLLRENLVSYLKPWGRLIMSGIIEEQVDDVINGLAEGGGVEVERFLIRDWVTLVGKQKRHTQSRV
jgi:ribosomal protein L11 methyltransferase